MREMHSKRLKFSKFSGGACPRTPLEARALRYSLKTPAASFSFSPPTSQILPSTPFLIENPVSIPPFNLFVMGTFMHINNISTVPFLCTVCLGVNKCSHRQPIFLLLLLLHRLICLLKELLAVRMHRNGLRHMTFGLFVCLWFFVLP